MSWGHPFREAWQDATPGARLAAREVVQSVERAAGSLSNPLLHALQLAQFAAQDLERLRVAALLPASATGSNAPLARTIDEMRQGRISPEKAERHLRQALQDAPREAQQATAAALAARANAAQQQRRAQQRLHRLRADVLLQGATLCQQLVERVQESSDTPGSCVHVARLAQACHTLERLFLDTRQATDPAVPLPAAPQDEGDQ